MKSLKIDKNNALILIVGGLSLISIFLEFRNRNYLSLANSIIGLTGVCLFFLKNDVFRYFLWTWIAAQAIIIDHSFTNVTTGITYDDPILDLSQIFRLKLGFSLSGSSNAYAINFNPVVILYFFLFRNLKTSSFIGRNIGLLPYERQQ